MAVTDAYFTATEYKNAVGKGSAADDTQIGLDALSISRWLDRRLHRFFNKDATAVNRDFYVPGGNGPIYPEAENPWKFSGTRGRTLHLDADVVSVTNLYTDDDGDGTPDHEIVAANYQLLPLNAALGPEPQPYTAIHLPTWSTELGWPAGRLVRINGIFGWPAVPASLKRGAIDLLAVVRLESPRAIISTDSMGSIVQASSHAKNIVDDLVKTYMRTTL